ncbi:MAG TPA: hypothetical protein VJT73_17555, partial [Polyangiaceae bacterium]|nr:hypothetical protein [Polyangiaceae bacterium]
MTPIVCCLALTSLVGLSADLHGTLSLSDRSTVNVRPAYGRAGSAVDLTTTPGIDLTFPGRRWLFN